MEMGDGEVWKQGRKNGYGKHIDDKNDSLWKCTNENYIKVGYQSMLIILFGVEPWYS